MVAAGTWPLLGFVWSMGFLVQTGSAYCPPCHGSIRMHTYNSLVQEDAQGRPWGVMVPPAPNAPLTPCGCGHKKATPRDDLRTMPKSTINKKINAMEKEIAELTSTMETAEDEHKDELEKLQGRLDKLTQRSKDEQADIVATADARTADNRATKDKVDADWKEITDINAKLDEIRSKNKQIREDLTIRMMDMEMCGCKSALLLQHQTSVLKHMEMPEGYDQILKFEKLESELQDLRKEQTAEMGDFGSKSRDLMHRIDLVKAKMNRQNITADKYKGTDVDAREMIDMQAGSMSKYLTTKQDQLQRMEDSYASNEKLYSDLEAEMGKCGCGPKAGSAPAPPAAGPAAAFLDRKYV